MRRQVASVIFLVLFSASLAFAQAVPASAGAAVPPVIRFSGTLAVAPGRVSVTFGFYQEETGGEPLWAETQTLLIDAAGRYQAVLGTTTALPVDTFAAGEARWLDVAVEGLAPQPRRLLVSVPYALKAADAETVGGKPLSAFVLAGDKTGVGVDGLTYVDTRVLASGLAASGAPGGAGTANFIGVFTDTTTLGNSVIYQTPVGNIGVNTQAPAAAFHVVAPAAPAAYFDVYSNALGALPVVYRAARGTPFAPTAVQANDILGGLAVRGYGASTFSAGRGQVMFKAAENWTDEANGTYLQFTTTPIGSGAWAERMRIDPAGRVGIGTQTPTQLLSVYGTIESTTGGFKFPDGTTQTTAGASYTAGVGLSLASSAFSVTFGGTGAANAAARSDHQHDGAYVALGGSYNNPAWLTGLAATKITGSLPVAQVAGAATLGANSFTGTQAINSGNLALPATTSAGSGVLTLGGQAFLHGYGATTYPNTFLGSQAGSFVITGSGGNVGIGSLALAATTNGSWNTAIGHNALSLNTGGGANTATGYSALSQNTTGHHNTATGTGTLTLNTTGYYNTAAGFNALQTNTTGYENTASGAQALLYNTTGRENTAIGVSALLQNTTGNDNVGIGEQSLFGNTTGSQNVALGYRAGTSLTTGNWNIDIGNLGVAGEGNTIRVGMSSYHTRTVIAGIRGVTTDTANAIPVLIDSNGQLGTVSSSRRVKDDIADMAAASTGLMKLRPVTFHYKSDQNPAGRTLQYGLIAEEVAEVYPGLVAHSADGQIETVMYQFLPPMLLNEYQKQQRTIDAQAARFEMTATALKAENDALRAQLAQLTERLERLIEREKR